MVLDDDEKKKKRKEKKTKIEFTNFRGNLIFQNIFSKVLKGE